MCVKYNRVCAGVGSLPVDCQVSAIWNGVRTLQYRTYLNSTLWAGQSKNRGSIPSTDHGFPLLQSTSTDLGDQLVTFPTGIHVPLPGAENQYVKPIQSFIFTFCPDIPTLYAARFTFPFCLLVTEAKICRILSDSNESEDRYER